MILRSSYQSNNTKKSPQVDNGEFRFRDREKLLPKAGTDTEVGKSNGGWLEAVVENGSQPRVPAGGGLWIYFAGGAYCQISSIGQQS